MGPRRLSRFGLGLVAMVGYTCLSLWLLAQPLTKETASTSGLAPNHPIAPLAVTAPAHNPPA